MIAFRIVAIESLRTFALTHNEITFAHLCAAAISGERWAVELVDATIEDINYMLDRNGVLLDYQQDHVRLECIRATDAIRQEAGHGRSP